jgi:vacuolar protein sorting-associated protein 13A/C
LVDSSFSIYTGFFNVRNSHWEPLIEPWNFNLKVTRALVSESMDIELSSKRKLEVNIEHTFLQTMLNFTNSIGGQKEVNAAPRIISLHIQSTHLLSSSNRDVVP